MTEPRGTPSQPWAAFFRQMISYISSGSGNFPISIANGGTGQTTQQTAITALSGTQASGKYLRSDGSNTTLSSILAADVPLLNQNTSGTAANVTGTVAIVNGGTGQITATAAANALLPSQTGNSGKFLKTDGTNPSWASSVASNTAPTVQKFTSGSGTYTTPTSPAPLYIRVRMVGGGGGGGGSGTASGGSGGNGGNTTFGATLLVANGGAGGQFNGATATGGTASLGTGPIGVAVQGAGGTGASNFNSNSVNLDGPPGASSAFGGAGSGGKYVGNSTDSNAATNSGSGGGGAGVGGSTSSTSTGASGAAGGFVDAIIKTPSATYSYVVGSAGSSGSAGTSGLSGGSGAAGIIIVEEYYQ